MATPKVSTKQTIIATPDQDALQIKDITGDILGWIDATGTRQGNLSSLGSVTSATAAAGGGQAVPGTVLGYLVVVVAGATVKIPYFSS
jgi:hypothetical protein